MTNVIENAAHKTLDSMNDATDAAKKQGSRLEKVAKLALRALPALPERTFDVVLDRLGLVRKPGGLVMAAAFAGGFVAGSVTTALTTPLSGPALRRKLGRTLDGWMAEGETELAFIEKKVQKGAKDLASDAKHAVEHGAEKLVDHEETVEKKLKNGSRAQRA